MKGNYRKILKTLHLKRYVETVWLITIGVFVDSFKHT